MLGEARTILREQGASLDGMTTAEEVHAIAARIGRCGTSANAALAAGLRSELDVVTERLTRSALAGDTSSPLALSGLAKRQCDAGERAGLAGLVERMPVDESLRGNLRADLGAGTETFCRPVPRAYGRPVLTGVMGGAAGGPVGRSS